MPKIVLPKTDTRDELKITTVKKLGSGTFGKVYQIKYNGKPAALKVVDKSTTKSTIDDLRQEIDIIYEMIKKFPKCKSKNLLCYVDISEDEDNIYFISDLMMNDLEKFLSSKHFTKLDGCKQVDVIWNIINQIIEGLNHLHDAGIIHRDVKLANILINKSKNKYTVKLADFGLSCLRNICSGMVGTPEFLPPRAVFKKKITWTPQDDFYSVGVTLYSILTGGEMMTSGDEINKYLQDEINMREALKIYNEKYDERIQILDDIRETMSECSLDTRNKLDKLIELTKELSRPQYNKIVSKSFIKKILN